MRKVVALLSGLALGFSSAQAIVKDAPARFSHAQPQLQSQQAHTYNVAFHGVNYQKLIQAERTILGRTFEHQDVDIRLNRLERSIFNRTHPELSYEQRIDNVLINASSNSTIGIQPANLSKIEQKVFDRTFGMDTTKNRIERLEHNMFGAVQSGDLRARYETILRASTRYREPVVSQVPPTSGWRGVLGNMLMGGMVTGMTPQLTAGMDPYAMDFLDERGAGGGAGYYTGNRGWGYNNRSTGSRTGVTILD